MRAFILFCLAFSMSFVKAQNTKVFPFGITEVVHSNVLKEDRTLNIYLPDSYNKDSSKNFAVIYVLDGSAHEDFPHLAGLAQFMMMYQLIPPSIVVGIANVDRYRDFTEPSANPEDKKKLPTSGGSAAFIAFIETELQPYIEKNYRTRHERTIIGQSLGGLIATEILFDHSNLFEQYIIVSPSLWWNHQSILNRADKALEKHLQKDKKVYVAVGEEPDEMKTGAKGLEQVLKKYITAQSVQYEFFPKETHATILHRAAYNGLEWLYPVKK